MQNEQYLVSKYLRLCLIELFICILSLSVSGQKKDKNKGETKIYGGQNGNLFTNRSNLIGVITEDSTALFTVKSSQGIISKLDKYMFFIDSLQKGKVTITIFKRTRGGNTTVRNKIYNVLVPKVLTRYNSLSISPGISLGGITNGKMKLDSLKKITELTINENYSIIEATIYIGVADLQIASIKSKYFDKNTKELWKRISPNCVISIDNIKFTDKKDNIYTYPKTIFVTAIE